MKIIFPIFELQYSSTIAMMPGSLTKRLKWRLSPERLFPSTNDGENSIVQVTNNGSWLDKLLRRS